MAEQAQKEPTMEEILSSIRKIIADDDGAEAPMDAAADALPQAPENDLDLDVFSDVAQGRAEDDFEPELPTSTDDVLQAIHSSADEAFEDEVDSFSIEDHETGEDMADIMDFIDFKKEPAPEPGPEFTDPTAEAADVFADALDTEDSFEAEISEPVSGIEAEYAPEPEADFADIGDYTAEPEPVAAFAEPEPEIEPTFDAVVEPAQIDHSEAEVTTPLTDHNTVNAAVGSLSKLLETVEFGEDAGGSKTIDGVVKELLRPMLKEWLDENLQGLVDAQVEAEIKRIGRRAG